MTSDDLKREAAEALFTEMSVAYTRQADGSLYVPKGLNLADKQLTVLPDLSMVDVGGDFWCDQNQLTSLKGGPRSVEGTYDCSHNLLVSLEGAPAECNDFDCGHNLLTVLRHAPQKVVDTFFCENNLLTSLEDAPALFSNLLSDFGHYNAWSQVPMEHRLPPETRARQMAETIRSITTLDAPLRIGRALSLQKPGKAFAP